MNDLEQRLKDVLETDASKAPRVPRAPKGLKREVRRRQIGTALIGTVAIVAMLGVSLAGLRAIDRTEGTTPVDDPWADYEVFERTAQIEGFTVTSPSDLYLVHQWPWAASVDAKLNDRREQRLEACGDLPTPEERRPCRAGLSGVPGDGLIIPVFMLSEHDHGLESSPCVDPSFAVAPDEAIMTIAWDEVYAATYFGAGDRPKWPVAFDTPTADDRMSCGPGTYVYFAAGDMPFVAHFAFGGEVDPERRQTVIDAFESMVADPTQEMFFDTRGTDPAYVIAGGENAAGPWSLELRPSAGSDPMSNIDLESITAEGGAVGLGDVILDEDRPIEQAGGDPVFGAVAKEATGVELKLEDGTPPIPAQIVPLPPSMPFNFDVFFASNPSDVPPTAVPLGIDAEGPSEPAPSATGVGGEARIVAEGVAGDTPWRLEFSAVPGENTLSLRDTRDGSALATLGPAAFDRLHRSGLELWPEAIPDGPVVIFGATAPAATSLAIALDGGPLTYLTPGDPRWDPAPVLTSTGLPGLRLWWSELPIDTGEVVTFSEGCDVLARKVFTPDHRVDPAPKAEIDARIDCVPSPG
jgi:hypothetical protein